MLADDLQQLEFNVFVSRKGKFIERVRLKFGAGDDFYFALSVSEGTDWTCSAITSTYIKSETGKENLERLRVDFVDQEYAFQQKSGQGWPLKAGNLRK